MARAWRLLLSILAAARPVAGAHEKYVIQAYDPAQEGDAGEPPDFAPGTNARRRTALKTPPTRHGRSRLISAMSFRSTRSLAAARTSPSVSGSSRSATSSRKSYRG